MTIAMEVVTVIAAADDGGVDDDGDDYDCDVVKGGVDNGGSAFPTLLSSY